MRTLSVILTCWLAGVWSTPMVAAPVRFARSGQRLAVSVNSQRGEVPESVVLHGLGAARTEPVAVTHGTAVLVAPKVRVPVVFRVKDAGPSGRDFGEVVVYPETPLRAKPELPLVSLKSPTWFNEWTEAVGLSVRQVADPTLLAQRQAPETVPLAILGQDAVTGELAGGCRLAAAQNVHVLVLATDWYACNRTHRREVAVFPQHMSGALADMRAQNWPLPPVFRAPMLRVMNRQTWIAGPEHPWVEEIRHAGTEADSVRVVACYLPWQEQLGRTEMADVVFLRLLSESARTIQDRKRMRGRWELVYPPVEEIKPRDRPVLASALGEERSCGKGEATVSDIAGYVLDLRGQPSLAEGFFEASETIRNIEARTGEHAQLLILGDHPQLDRWKWLESGRARGYCSRAGVLWWPDIPLPCSMDWEIRLMQLFTQWNVPLRDANQENPDDN